ncbi:MAG TPA: type II toxin-antitoxin system prevent-host-death family antitoxin [Alphaproteobacteria bacterium]|nr:type II toxin-antitoxin system prevent-host-death family antitoxin [Alphaproteobacteria bacterium]
MTKTVNLYEAKTKLSELVERAAKGEEIVIAKAGKPRGKLVPIPVQKAPRVGGFWKGKFEIHENFDDPLPDDIQRAFEGEEN